jgi:hypothetical protein
MLKKYLNKLVPKIALLLICTLPLNQALYAARAGSRRTRTTNTAAADARAQKLEQQKEMQGQAMIDAAKDVDSKLVELLNLINKNQKPSSEKIASALKTIEETSKFLSRFDSKTQCEHYMLKAWANYFNNEPKTANQTAKQAYRTDQENNDAFITQAAIAILTDNKPIVQKPKTSPAQTQSVGSQRPQRQRPQSRRRQNAANTSGSIRVSGSVGSGKILQLDVEAINADMLGKKIQPLEVKCINATTLTCDPAQENLCIMFWQLPESSIPDPNEPSQKQSAASAASGRVAPQTMARPEMMSQRRSSRTSRRPDRTSRRGATPGETAPRRPEMMMPGRPDMMGPGMMRPEMMMMGPGMMGPGMSQYPFGTQTASQILSPERTLETQMDAFGQLFDSSFDNPGVKFLAVNTDQPKVRKKVVKQLLQSPWPWANVMANDPSGGAEQFKDVDAQQPTLTIVDKNATMKYAGPAEGFLAPMVLEKTAGITISSQQEFPADPNSSLTQAPIDLSETINQIIKSNPQMITKLSSDDDMLTPEEFQAQKLFEYAKGLYIPAGKKAGLTPKQGIELCRQIMKDYPDSPYAEQAKKLLRELPEEDRKKYKITNEEMGL